AEFLSAHIGLAVGPQRLKVERGGSAPAGAISYQRGTGEDLGSEGYTLEISREGIVITADTPAGAFYGTQTLRQLLPPAWEHEALRPPRKGARPTVLRALRVRDRPRYAWRGAMLDVSRHFFTVDEVKRYIDLMALHKLNR